MDKEPKTNSTNLFDLFKDKGLIGCFDGTGINSENFKDLTMDDELRDLQLDSWNYKHAQDHFIGLYEALLESKSMDVFLEHFEELAAALDVPVDLDKVESGIDAL